MLEALGKFCLCLSDFRRNGRRVLELNNDPDCVIRFCLFKLLEFLVKLTAGVQIAGNH